MDVSDYSNRLTQVREDYAKKNQRLREDYERNLQATNEVHESKQKKMSSNYKESKEKLEKENEDQVRYYSDETKRVLRDKQQEFRSGLDDQRETFEKEREGLRNHYGERLKDIQEDYHSSLTEGQRYHDDVLKHTTDKLNDRTVERERLFNKETQRLQKASTDSFRNYKDGTNLEKSELVRQAQRDMVAAGQEKNTALNELKTNYSGQIDGIRELHGRELRDRADHHSSLMEGQRAKNKLENQELTDSYKNLNDKLQKRTEFERRRQDREQANQIQDMQRVFNDDLEALKMKANKITNATTDGSEGRARMDRMAKLYDNRIEHLNNELKQVQVDAEHDKEQIKYTYQDALRAKSRKHSGEIEKREKEFYKFSEETNNNYFDEKEGIVDQFREQIREKDQVYEENVGMQRVKTKDRLDKQRKIFGQTISDLTQRNVDTVSNIQDEFAKEKTRVIEGSKKDTHRALRDQKDDFRVRIDKTVESYEKRLHDKENQIKRLTEQYENRIANMQEKMAKDDKKRLEEGQEEKEMLQRTNRFTIEAKEKEYLKQFMAMKKRYAMELERSKFENDMQVTKLTKRYEGMMDRLKNEYEAELTTKLGVARREYENLVKSTELEKEAIRGQYETKLEKMRMANAADLERNMKRA